MKNTQFISDSALNEALWFAALAAKTGLTVAAAFLLPVAGLAVSAAIEAGVQATLWGASKAIKAVTQGFSSDTRNNSCKN